MDNLKIIENLKEDLPKTVAVIGYGSGIYKQTGYTAQEKPDKDVIIVVDDFQDFLIADYAKNTHHFSKDFTLHDLSKKREDFYSNVGCLKFYHDNTHFKAMVISKKALEQDMKTWKYFGMAGRLTKPILYQNIPEDLEKAIQKNRENILITALLLNCDDILSPTELYNTISKMTYMYDFRTILPGEKKSKPTDIVNGAFNFFEEVYRKNELVFSDEEYIYNSHPVGLIEQLPDNLRLYLNMHLKTVNLDEMSKQDLEKLSTIIKHYFRKTNFPNSLRLALSSSATLGGKETFKHGLSKVKRHFLK